MKNSVICCAALLASICSEASAEIKLEDGDNFLSLLTLGARHDDNISQDPKSQPRDSSAIAIVQPAFLFKVGGSKVTLDGAYTLTNTSYEYDSKDNHTDHQLLLGSQFALDASNKASLSFDYIKKQDIRTSINRAASDEEVGDRSRFTNLSGQYRLGADSARAQLELNLGSSNLSYSNNLNTSSQNRLKERDMISQGGTFYVRIAPKTRILLEAIRTDFEYEESESLLNNNATKYYAGVIWEATAKTSSYIRIGQEDKNFDSDGAQDTSEPAWDINITWQPRSYSRINLTTGKGAAEGSVRSDVIQTTNTTLSWTHDWSYQFESRLSYTSISEDYEGKTFNGREDDTNTASAALTYTINRNVQFSGKYSRKERVSNSPVEEFDSNIVEINLTLAI
ncbi:outer membrane beta-barrel protein [Zhongshania arctica]|uniref:Outer membrane beta-barrel protein n=1 Tax=Zhongshania arctica TaxID=3238302 RepID=A0ABV3TRK9_9GAMM